MWFTYLLQSQKDEGFYVGFSSDIERRYTSHQAGLVDSTQHRRPLTLIYYEAFRTKDEAMERERQLKQFGSAYNALLKRLKRR